MTVINTCDFNQTKSATIAIAEHNGPVYLRFGRPKVPVFIPENEPFIIGKALKLIEGNDVTIVATGHLVWEAVKACEVLENRGISADVLNIHSIKPLDEKAILDSVVKTKCVVTAEEHQVFGGLGESVARVLSMHNPSPIEMVAVQDSFGESGTPDQLMEKYGLKDVNIIEAVERVIARK